jgi:hypothetical protein
MPGWIFAMGSSWFPHQLDPADSGGISRLFESMGHRPVAKVLEHIISDSPPASPAFAIFYKHSTHHPLKDLQCHTGCRGESPNLDPVKALHADSVTTNPKSSKTALATSLVTSRCGCPHFHLLWTSDSNYVPCGSNKVCRDKKKEAVKCGYPFRFGVSMI